MQYLSRIWQSVGEIYIQVRKLLLLLLLKIKMWSNVFSTLVVVAPSLIRSRQCMPLVWQLRKISEKLNIKPNNLSKVYANMAQIIDGSGLAKDIRCELRKELEHYVAAGNRAPHLTAIIVGEDPASRIYVEHKINACKEIGITSDTKVLPASTTEEELLQVIQEQNDNPNVNGILVQLPVPDHINERTICNAVNVEKDVDGFHEINMGRLALDMDCLIPATPQGIKAMLESLDIDTFGKNAVVVGRSKNVSLPMAILLSSDGKNATKALDATVTICHRYTPPKELTKFCKQADIIVVAVGKPGLITKDMVKPGACVIDVGINRIKDEATGNYRLVGDVDFDEVRQVAGYISPVPGGVGPMTVAMLMRNTIQAAKKQQVAARSN